MAQNPFWSTVDQLVSPQGMDQGTRSTMECRGSDFFHCGLSCGSLLGPQFLLAQSMATRDDLVHCRGVWLGGD